MRDPVLPRIGAMVRQARKRRNLTQAALAERVGRPTPRISELETELLRDRTGRDRLALLAEVCDALDLALVALPRDLAENLIAALSPRPTPPKAPAGQASRFDELFVDLSDEPGEGPEGRAAPAAADGSRGS